MLEDITIGIAEVEGTYAIDSEEEEADKIGAK